MIVKNKMKFLIVFIFTLFHLPIEAAKEITAQDIKEFSKYLHITYGALWTELEDMYRNKQGVFASQYQKHLKSLEDSSFQIIEVKNPFIHIRRLCTDNLTGNSHVCPELWIKENDSYVRISKEEAHKIIIGNFDDNEYPDAIITFGCCASHGIQILCSEQHVNKLERWTIRNVYEKYLDAQIRFDSLKKCELLKVAFKPRNANNFRYIKTNCENGRLIVNDIE